jgi:hypothetical protein
MRGMRRITTTAGLLVLALLPIGAAVSPQAAAPTPVPVAITQPLMTASPFFHSASPVLPESGLILMAGAGLLGLAAVVRKVTSD